MSLDNKSLDQKILDAAQTSKAWPFEEARKILKRLKKSGGEKKEVIFETGYGPSGLPHIGTFGEVARTSMVRHAFNILSENKIPTRLICFSDDMDGLRKVPDNVPNKELLTEALERPLTSVPDPFEKYESFAHHNNAMLRSFLDQFGFEYEFYSATECYKSGRFDETLLKMLSVYDDVMNIILPTLGKERQQSYSPFLPICPRTGRVLQVPMIAQNSDAGTITYQDPETGKDIETPVTGGNVKCQWKADWAMRWAALGVDYEMAGKDLIESVHLSGRICRAMGATPPEGFNYELFLDEKGEKISKSKGNGLTIDEWLKYANPESLSLFMFQKPKTAKRLYFDIIPKNVDEYLTFAEKSHALVSEGDAEKLVANPAWHIHSGQAPQSDVPISFSLLLNLVSASNAEDKDVLWGFIRRYAEDATPENHPKLDDMVGYAIAYYHDFVKPTKQYRAPDDKERAAMEDLSKRLKDMDKASAAADLQSLVYEIGKAHEFENLRNWFSALYEVLLGQSQGPRFGSFIELYGVEETCAMIDEALARK